MGREGVKRKKIVCGRHLKKKSFPKMRKGENITIFSSGFVEHGGGSHENFHFSSIGGVKFCLREGDCVLGGQLMGIPPVPLPLPMCGGYPYHMFVCVCELKK